MARHDDSDNTEEQTKEEEEEEEIAAASDSATVSDNAQTNENEGRREAVKGAFLHAWNSYVLYAWGRDELEVPQPTPTHTRTRARHAHPPLTDTHMLCGRGYKPLSRRGKDWLGQGITILDSLDTLHIMGLHQEFQRARAWVRDSLRWDDKV